MNDLYNCGQKAIAPAGLGTRPSFLESLKRRRTELTDHLTETEAAIKALEADPKITQVLEALRKVSGLL